ncbi:hypothetical protein PoB_007083800 [Plakobranchus ocellatus]|uniref:Uncharacterized protein n=1 Tax=Plakobranchus ocellatus TaxID=259542 RepID=A0AAV4DJU5_9GAST|nr:hypothetical protein PoB_007083800 [Plakobranchus ocellatus]
MKYIPNIERIDPSSLGLLNHQTYYVEGRGRQLLAYRSCSSHNQISLQRPVIKKEKARGTNWALIRESFVLYYSSDKKAGHARKPIVSLSRLIVPVQRESP